MLSIGEFSKICRVSAKTLRYYAEIGLIQPEEINQENGYRYYSAGQLERMLFISRLKSYNFSLEEIKAVLESGGLSDDKLCMALAGKKTQMEKQIEEFSKTLEQMEEDISNLKQGKSIMAYLENIDVQLSQPPAMCLLSIRKNVPENGFEAEYGNCFGALFRKIADGRMTVAAPPMVLFHSSEFSPFGLDTEFAVPVEECGADTRAFQPGLCLKTILRGSYSNLPSVYAKQREWAEKEGYESSDALFEVYVTDPAQVSGENELVTEIYYPVKKKKGVMT